MLFETEHDAFARALGTVARAVPTRTTLPVLTGILIRAERTGLVLASTDLDIAIECLVPAEVSEEGAVVLPARYLTEMVRRIPGGLLRWSTAPDRPVARLIWQRSEFSLQGFSAEQFPARVQVPAEAAPLPRGRLRAALAHTVFAASADTARPVLTGVSLALAARSIEAIATDGTRVAVHRDPQAPEDLTDVARMLVPAKGLQEVLRCLDGDGDVRLGVHERQLIIDLGDTRMGLRLLEGRYPAVMELLPADYPTTVRADRRALHDACERVSLVADSGEHLYAVQMEAANGAIRLTARNPEVGEASEDVAARLEGPDAQVGFNARLLLEGLRHIEGDEVTLQTSGTESAARLFNTDNPAFVYIQMPVRMR